MRRRFRRLLRVTERDLGPFITHNHRVYEPSVDCPGCLKLYRHFLSCACGHCPTDDQVRVLLRYQDEQIRLFFSGLEEQPL